MCFKGQEKIMGGNIKLGTQIIMDNVDAITNI
jgi:hypothetical protein